MLGKHVCIQKYMQFILLTRPSPPKCMICATAGQTNSIGDYQNIFYVSVKVNPSVCPSSLVSVVFIMLCPSETLFVQIRFQEIEKTLYFLIIKYCDVKVDTHFFKLFIGWKCIKSTD